MIKLAISGVAGRMGGRILDLALKDPEFKVVAGLEQKGHTLVGKLVQGVKITDDSNAIKNADCLIEFTTPSATLSHIEFALKHKTKMVIGTTGLTPEEKKIIEVIASSKIPIVLSSNMSIGVNTLFDLVSHAAKVLGKDYKARIIEAHHIHKIDAPSGTAKTLAQNIRNSGGEVIEPIESIREGEIIGDHRVIFESNADKLEFFHSAKTRDIFAIGALQAAKWITHKKSGLFDMQEVLGLK